jgi:hypothetical protein
VATIPFPVSANHILIVEVSQNEIIEKNINGMIAVQFRPPAAEGATATVIDFQLAQTKVDPDLQFKLVGTAQAIPFGLIGNKPFEIRQSVPGKPNPDLNADFSASASGDGFAFVIQRFAQQSDFYQLLERAQVRFYPANPLLEVVNGYLGGFVSLRMAGRPAERTPAFEAGVKIRSLPGASARVFVLTNLLEPINRLVRDQQVEVIRYEPETGRLWVTTSVGPEGFIDSWLVQVVE